MLYQNIHLFTIIAPLLMGLLSFAIKNNQHHIVINSIYSIVFFLFFIVIVYGVFKCNLLSGEEYSVVVGGWKKSMGIEIKYNLKCALAIISTTFVILTFFITNLTENISSAFRGFACIMFCGANGIIVTNDIFNTYVFFEIICITTYIIYSHSNDKICLKNTYNYMILSGFVSVIFLLIISFLYQITNNLNIDLLNKSLSSFYGSKTVSAIFVLFILSMMFKLGLYPVHNVVVDIYKHLSLKYLIIVAGLSSIAYPFFIIKFITNLFGNEVIINNENLSVCLKIFGTIGFIFFNSIALSSTYVLNFIIALSFSQVSLLAFCLPFLTNKQVIYGLLFTISSHTIIKVCMFSILYKIQKQIGILKIKISDISAISSKTYKLLFVLLLFFISGMPLSLVFMSKWYLLVGIFNIHTNILWLFVLVIGFAIDLVACFMFIKHILVKNNSKVLEVNNSYPLIVNIVVVIFFLFVSTFFVGKFQ